MSDNDNKDYMQFEVTQELEKWLKKTFKTAVVKAEEPVNESDRPRGENEESLDRLKHPIADSNYFSMVDQIERSMAITPEEKERLFQHLLQLQNQKRLQADLRAKLKPQTPG